MGALTVELRRRLDVPVDLVPDALLDDVLTAAAVNLAPWVAPADPGPHPFQGNIDRATVALAVKLWDTQSRGVASSDVLGTSPPRPSASPGLARSVFGELGPALYLGGVSV